MIYLATPFSHPDVAVRHKRYETACRVAGELLKAGVHVYSPICNTYGMEVYAGTDVLPWEYWEPYDRWFLERCEELLVLKMDGWEQSRGVQAEIRIFQELGKPVNYMDYLEYTDDAQ